MSRPFLRSSLLVTLCLSAPTWLGGYPALAEEDAGLVGRWESVARSRGGIGTVLELRADGVATRTPGAMVDGTYRLDGAVLVTSFADPASGSVVESHLRVELRGDTMIHRDRDSGEKIRLTRVTELGEDAPSIVGTWTFEHPAGTTAFQTFTADGAVHLRVPFVTEKGRYSVAGDALTLELAGSDRWEGRYEIDDSMLTLIPASGEPERYRRAP